MFRAKYEGQCALCFKFWEPGAPIARLEKPVKTTNWYDFGRRKGQKYTVMMKYAHAECARELQKEKMAA